MIKKWYGRRMYAWENDLALRATNRVVRPFDWGLEWTENWPVAQRAPRNGYDAEAYLQRLNHAAIAHSEEFFGYERPSDFRLTGDMLRFTSPVRTPYPENNTVHARVFPAQNTKKAVSVL